MYSELERNETKALAPIQEPFRGLEVGLSLSSRLESSAFGNQIASSPLLGL